MLLTNSTMHTGGSCSFPCSSGTPTSVKTEKCTKTTLSGIGHTKDAYKQYLRYYLLFQSSLEMDEDEQCPPDCRDQDCETSNEIAAPEINARLKNFLTFVKDTPSGNNDGLLAQESLSAFQAATMLMGADLQPDEVSAIRNKKKKLAAFTDSYLWKTVLLTNINHEPFKIQPTTVQSTTGDALKKTQFRLNIGREPWRREALPEPEPGGAEPGGAEPGNPSPSINDITSRPDQHGESSEQPPGTAQQAVGATIPRIYDPRACSFV
ncbi:unnamed protein product [Nesidiocoris tenuis]|uniref:Uncharacterized protein n=1 Tax=Nesidiocoris tenuis TaxID=355587 RepID=A0A6H5HDC1_9HEMI|nr:unnamed protein product [Nesidiocoris tenuis]